jgi:hypothetical protein
MHDGEQADGARNRTRFVAGCRLDRLQLAAAGAVQDVPAALTQPLADRVGGGEVAETPALDALVEQSLSFGSIRSSWL